MVTKYVRRRRREPVPAEPEKRAALVVDHRAAPPADRAMRALSILPASMVTTKHVLDDYLDAIGVGR